MFERSAPAIFLRHAVPARVSSWHGQLSASVPKITVQQKVTLLLATHEEERASRRVVMASSMEPYAHDAPSATGALQSRQVRPAPALRAACRRRPAARLAEKSQCHYFEFSFTCRHTPRTCRQQDITAYRRHAVAGRPRAMPGRPRRPSAARPGTPCVLRCRRRVNYFGMSTRKRCTGPARCRPTMMMPCNLSFSCFQALSVIFRTKCHNEQKQREQSHDDDAHRRKIAMNVVGMVVEGRASRSPRGHFCPAGSSAFISARRAVFFPMLAGQF